jgi:cytochrome P450
MTTDPQAVERPPVRLDTAAPGAASPPRQSPAERMMLFFFERPWLLNRLVRALGRHWPVIVLGRHAAVLGNAEICAVLTRDADFVVDSDPQPVFRDGPFVLRLQPGPRYLHEIDVLRRVVLPADLAHIGNIAKDEAQRRVAGLTGNRVDVIGDLAVPVGLRLIRDYLGAAEPLPTWLAHYLRRLASFVLVGGFHDPVDRAQADAAAEALRSFVLACMAERRRALAGGAAGNDVLTRLMVMAGRGDVDEDFVRRNFTGLLIVSQAVVANALALVVDELLRRPDALAATRKLADAGDSGQMAGYAMEALRFNPVFPVLCRSSPKATSLADHTGRTHQIPAGATVFIGIVAGLCDKAVFDDPDRFVPGRKPDGSLVFGHGTHVCFGRHIAAVELSEMLTALLRLRGLRRAPGDLGKPQYDGPAIERLLLDFQGGAGDAAAPPGPPKH